MVLGRNVKIVAVVVVVIILLLVAMAVTLPPLTSESNSKIQVVAAENFWGSLVSQLGGVHVQVTSVVSDPNADPHEYESNTSTARSFASADLIIQNGAGYDSWSDKLISAGIKSDCIVLNVADLLGKKNGDNPHFWYDPDYVNRTVAQMEADLISIDPAHSAYYEQQYTNLSVSLAAYQGKSAEIRQSYAGTRIAGTEDIVQYLANSTGLDLVSPLAFMQAVAEGNDPPAASIAQFQDQLQSGNVSVLVYNLQTVTPITEQMKSLATSNGIQTVGITETVQPPGMLFQDWMYSELVTLENALNAARLAR